MNLAEDYHNQDVRSFVQNGFVRIDGAFSRATAAKGRSILWRDTGCDPLDRGTWNRPVIRLGGYSDPPFQEAANSPRLVAAFDQLIGAGRWLPRGGLGTFPVRFPSEQDPGDTGWHVDASYPPPSGEADQGIFQWRINIFSRDRALLMLFLFSDVGIADAPTRIRVGSHFDVARILAPAGESGMSFMQLAKRLDESADRPEVLATGEAGTVYLCHPFLVHAAQPHHGSEPRFLAQPPLGMAAPFQLERADGDYSPAERAIRIALGLEAYMLPLPKPAKPEPNRPESVTFL
ncbi:MAG TPA: phytanoyl-CoA dioxygenase family protein [Bryobacteraceae bacterium]